MTSWLSEYFQTKHCYDWWVEALAFVFGSLSTISITALIVYCGASLPDAISSYSIHLLMLCHSDLALGRFWSGGSRSSRTKSRTEATKGQTWRDSVRRQYQ